MKIAAWREAYAHILDPTLLAKLDIGRESAKWRERIIEHSETVCFLVACDGTEINGYCVVGPNRFPEVDCDAELQAIYVHPSAQRTGVGRLLLKPAVDWLVQKNFHSMVVFVFRDNPKGVGFYKSVGARFRDSGELEIGGTHYPDESYVWASLAELQELFEKE